LSSRASLVQLYTALVFAGPGLLQRIKSGLADLLRRDGFASVADAVGADVTRVVECSP
jgi:dihydroorotate dehydrogenase